MRKFLAPAALAALSIAFLASPAAAQCFGTNNSPFGCAGGTLTNSPAYPVQSFRPAHGGTYYAPSGGGYAPQGTQLVAVTPYGAVPVNANGQQVNCQYGATSGNGCQLGQRRTNWGRVGATVAIGAGLGYLMFGK